MELLELIKRRYSCRSYKSKSVENERLDYIMECVRYAPSAVNKQPWMFRIISSEEDRKKISQCYNREWFATAPVVINEEAAVLIPVGYPADDLKEKKRKAIEEIVK